MGQASQSAGGLRARSRISQGNQQEPLVGEQHGGAKLSVSPESRGSKVRAWGRETRCGLSEDPQ